MISRDVGLAMQEAEMESEHVLLGQHPPGIVARMHGAIGTKHDIL